MIEVNDDQTARVDRVPYLMEIIGEQGTGLKFHVVPYESVDFDAQDDNLVEQWALDRLRLEQEDLDAIVGGLPVRTAFSIWRNEGRLALLVMRPQSLPDYRPTHI